MNNCIPSIHLVTSMIVMVLSLIMTSGNGQESKTKIENNTPLISTSIKTDEYKDPLFFIEGQLCQHIRRIFQDKKGDLWFGTNVYGLMRYDGKSLDYFDKKNGLDFSRVTGFTQDKDGNLWISSYQGITKYDGQSFTLFTDKDGLLNNETWCITADSKGIFWIGTNKGISRFDGKKFSTFSIPGVPVKTSNTLYDEDRIVSIVEDKNGNLWFGTDGFGICRFDGETFTNFTTEDGLCDNVIHELMADSKGNIWIGTFFGGLSMYDGNKFTNFTKEGRISGVEVSGFFEDKKGNIWFAAENNGVYRYDGNSFINFNEKDGLITNGILSIFEDREGRFWFGGWGGLFRYDKGIFTPVTKDGPWK